MYNMRILLWDLVYDHILKSSIITALRVPVDLLVINILSTGT